jgi:hypothetical protein
LERGPGGEVLLLREHIQRARPFIAQERASAEVWLALTSSLIGLVADFPPGPTAAFHILGERPFTAETQKEREARAFLLPPFFSASPACSAVTRSFPPGLKCAEPDPTFAPSARMALNHEHEESHS